MDQGEIHKERARTQWQDPGVSIVGARELWGVGQVLDADPERDLLAWRKHGLHTKPHIDEGPCRDYAHARGRIFAAAIGVVCEILPVVLDLDQCI